MVLPADPGDSGRGSSRSFCMWSRPALPNICGAGGEASGSRISNMRVACWSSALVRSVYLTPRLARLHLLEADRERAVDQPALDGLSSQEQRRGAGRAVVVDVDDRDPGEAQLVESALAVGRVAVAVAGVGLLDVLVGDASIGERLLRPPPWPSPGSRPPWCRASRTWSSRPRSRTCACSNLAPVVSAGWRAVWLGGQESIWLGPPAGSPLRLSPPSGWARAGRPPRLSRCRSRWQGPAGRQRAGPTRRACRPAGPRRS